MKQHNSNTENNPVWLTPPKIIQSLGVFELDPCAPQNRPWDTALKHYTEIDNGLIQDWENLRVWLNPPYGHALKHWMKKMSAHRNGIAMIFGRTDTKAMQHYTFPFAESILFLQGRVKFFDSNGIQAKSDGGAPSILVSYTEYDSEMIDASELKGYHVAINPKIFIAGISFDQNKSWRIIVGEALEELNCEAALPEIYEAVIKLAPNKIRSNQNYKAKVRQILQLHYDRISKATYALN